MSAAQPATASQGKIALEFDLPAPPQSLARLAALMREPDVDLITVAAVVENDLSFAAAVMKAVNSPLYGLRGSVQSVQQAVTYLGVRELTAIVYEHGLRQAFPPVPALHALWDRARRRGLLMGRLAQALAMEAWGAHSAGLFEECGKAVLFRHGPDTYLPLWQAAGEDDTALVEAEKATFGIGHDELGARLCEHWGLSPAAVASVRFHVQVQAQHHLPRVAHRYVCVLSALADTVMKDPDRLEAVAARLAPQAMLDQTSLLRGLQRVRSRLDEVVNAP